MHNVNRNGKSALKTSFHILVVTVYSKQVIPIPSSSNGLVLIRVSSFGEWLEQIGWWDIYSLRLDFPPHSYEGGLGEIWSLYYFDILPAW